ncbi:MAG: LPS-assembly protein LptD [Nitrospirae bacterium]|nr:MAG: LPS-assembly protein LptD [Nitrospirota bacterium]
MNKELRASAAYTGVLLLLLISFQALCFTGICSAADATSTSLTSDSLQYYSDTKKYVATGSVTATRGDAVIKADEITYSEDSSEVLASGNVTFDDQETSIKAERAEFNMEAKTGRLYKAEFLQKKTHYHLLGEMIEKRGENYYYSPEATFTTCDLPMPEWCFKGKEITAVVGDTFKAKDVSFLVKDHPLFYSPYFWASINKERHTGFLLPTPSYSKTRGAGINLPFFWAISENRDMTLSLDTYSRRGVGTGLEYRSLDIGEIRSNGWVYYIKDTLLNKDFLEVRATHEDRDRGPLRGFLNINYVNEKDFYREYTSYRDIRIQRYLESTAEVALPLDNARLYLLSQYWVDLKNSNGSIPQRLPEAGFVQNYSRLGQIMLTTSATASNMLRENGISATRFDIYPRILHSVGKDITLSQIVGLRNTFYSFYKGGGEDSTADRTAFEYDLTGHMRLQRSYGLIRHILEPSVRYHVVSVSKNSLPLFDATELYKNTSAIELSVLNRGIVKGSEVLTLRVTQGIETDNDNRPLQPLRFDAGMTVPLPLSVTTTYDYYASRIETASADVSIPLSKATVSLGQRYNHTENIHVYTAGLDLSPSKELHLTGTLWYDTRGGGLQDLHATLKYTRQCWSMRLEADKKPGDFSMKVMFELSGISTRMGSKK